MYLEVVTFIQKKALVEASFKLHEGLFEALVTNHGNTGLLLAWV